MQYRDPSTGNFKELYFKGGDTLPIGSIVPFGGTLVPTNWLICDGSAVSRTTYADLFAVIGTSFGTGDGSTTFNLPDMRSRVPLGKDSRDTDFDTIGETYGEKTHTLTVAEMPRHSHEIYRTAEGEEWVYTFNTSSARGDYYEYANTGFVGGDGAHNIVQPSLVTNYIIKAFQSAGVVGNVTNVKSNSIKDTYSCDFLNDSLEDVYSTDETITNKKWTNSKPVYRKVLEGTSISGNISTGITNLDVIIKMEALVKESGVQAWRTIPWLFSYDDIIQSGAWAGGFSYINGDILFQAGSYLLNIDKYIIIIEYTKTTDSASV